MTNSKALDSLDEIAVEAYMQLDLRAAADKIEYTCGGLLAEPPPGIYMLGRLDPILTPNKPCYWKDGAVRKPVGNFDEIKGSIYDEAGKILVSERLVKERAKYLSSTPLLPYRGILIAKELVDYYINQYVSYRRGSRNLSDMVAKHFSTDELAHFGQDQLNDIESSFRRERAVLTEFLGNHNWNIYFTHLQVSTIVIEKCMDWRAWEWELKHGKDYRNNKYEPGAQYRDDDEHH